MKNLQVTYQYDIHESGILVKRSPSIECRSFTKNFAAIVMMEMGGVATAVDTSNTTYTSVSTVVAGDWGYNPWRVTVGTSGNDDCGILIGTGTTAVTINDYMMETLIVHGTSAGQMQYANTTVGSPSATSTTATFRTTRVFTNDSGGSIDVEEIGLVTYSNFWSTTSSSAYSNKYILIIHDVTGGITVTDSQSLTINYDLTTTI